MTEYIAPLDDMVFVLSELVDRSAPTGSARSVINGADAVLALAEDLF